MIKVVEDAFIIIHIRISSIKIFGVNARHIVTGALIFFILINTIRLLSTANADDRLGFFEAAIFIVTTLIFCLAWIMSWPKASKLLNKVVKYEEEYNKKK